MKFIASHLVPSITSALIGLFIGVIFEDYLKNAFRNIKRKLKYAFKKKEENISHLFTVEGLETNFFVVEGDGVIEFKKEHVECRKLNDRPSLPEEIQVIKDEITKKEEENLAKGLDHKWNGPLYGLSRYVTTRQGAMEDPSAVFHFHETDYYTFLATNMQLDRTLESGKTIRDSYLQEYQLEKVQPILANGFGVVLVIITDDDQLLMVKRANSSGARANDLDVSVVEGVHPSLDLDPLTEGPNLFAAARRGAKEELGLDIGEEDISFLGYGIDLDYYQWNMIGHVRITQSSNDVAKIRSQGASGKWESRHMFFEDFNARNVARLIVKEPMWSTAKVALYWSAINHLGKNNIDRAIKRLMR